MGDINVIHNFLEYLISNKANDLHISSGSKPKIRKFGDLEDIPGYPELTDDYVKKIF